MIQFAPEAVVNLLLKQGCMIKAGPDTLFNTNKSHCVMLLNPTPLVDDYLVFVSASAQYEKRIEYSQKLGLPVTTVVMIRPNIYHHLPKYTAVDCNFIHTATRGVLATLLSENRIGFYKTSPKLNGEHLGKILSGVAASPMVSEEIKKIITSV